MRRIRRVLRWATYLVFYWMAGRVCLESAVISSGWHRLHPEWSPWIILLDAALALVMYGILWLDERYPL